MSKKLIKNGIIVNEGRRFRGSILVDGDRIAKIYETENSPETVYDTVIDARESFVIPGVVDSHVHFREPGLTHKATIASESMAAVAGGVTTFFDMPNCVPQTTSRKALEEKQDIAHRDSMANYAFFIGATNDNLNELLAVDYATVPGVKLFMGSSTGNMLVDKREALERLFASVSVPIMAHCEDTAIINANMEAALSEVSGTSRNTSHSISQVQKLHRDYLPISLHPLIRSEEACYKSTALAVELAAAAGTCLHVAHVSTEKELGLFPQHPASGHSTSRITFELTPAHLTFSSDDYHTLGSRIKCNPAIKTPADRAALRAALASGRFLTIGTDHAPHLLGEKEGGAARAVSGMPMVQFSLPLMLSLADCSLPPDNGLNGHITMERIVEVMCHNPATLFSLKERGFIREGYKADIAIVVPTDPYEVKAADVLSLCGWSPLEGRKLTWRVTHTLVNGQIAYNNGTLNPTIRGEAAIFNH